MKVLVVCGVLMFAFFAYMIGSIVHQAEQVQDAADVIMQRYAR